MRWIAGLITMDVLLYIAIGLFGAILLFGISWTIAVMVLRKKHGIRCSCGPIQTNLSKRWGVLAVAWLFTIFAVLTAAAHSLNGGFLNVFDFVLPIAFILLVYLFETLFSLITRVRCACSCKHDGIPPAPQKEKKIKEVVIASDSEAIPQSEPEHTETAVIARSDSETIPQPERKKPAPTKPTPAPAKKTKPTQKKKPAPAKKTKEQLQAEKRNSHIEELGVKIEKQRKQAEKIADAMPHEPRPEPYSAATHDAIASVDTTTARMDELQKRIAALRSNTHTERTVEEKIVKKSSQELLVQKEKLQQQYTTLQLSKMQNANRFNEDEVRNALAGLKTAMNDLQKQIDETEE
jgi:hypothetical protein